MADSDRLNELRRQRTLIADHLAWIDRDIAKITKIDAPADRLPSSKPTQRLATRSAEAETTGQINEWSEEDLETESQIPKTGCWLWFAAVILLGIGAVVLFITLNY